MITVTLRPGLFLLKFELIALISDRQRKLKQGDLVSSEVLAIKENLQTNESISKQKNYSESDYLPWELNYKVRKLHFAQTQKK